MIISWYIESKWRDKNEIKITWCLFTHTTGILFSELDLVKNVMVYIYWTFMFSLVSIKFKASSWSWSYGSWIYNYLCNQCLSPPKLWVRIALMTIHDDVYSIQHYVIKFVSDLWQVCGFLWVLRFPPPIKLTDTIYCNWNIVESGINKHHNPNPQSNLWFLESSFLCIFP